MFALSPSGRISFLFGAVALVACESVLSQASLPSANETSAVPHSADSDHNGTTTAPIHPILNAEQALTHLLTLIRSSKNLQDFTPQRLQEVMGTPIKHATDGHDRYGFGESLTRQWSYGFGVDWSLPSGSRFEFSFNENTPGASFPMTDICHIDFNRFRAELEAVGFTSEPYYGEHGALINLSFTRPKLYIEVYPEGEANEPVEKINHRCVKMVLIY